MHLGDVAGDQPDAEHAGAGQRHRDRHAEQQAQQQHSMGSATVMDLFAAAPRSGGGGRLLREQQRLAARAPAAGR